MSCIRFNTPAQRAQMRAHAPAMLTAAEAAELHPAPPVTESKIRRLRLLAEDSNPKIRESVASSYHAPADVFERLARDADPGVRACVARNEAAPCDLLRELAGDENESVRGWVAVNFYVPADAMERLAEDDSELVRSLVAWKASLAEQDEQRSVERGIQFAQAVS
ncbi:hypothetical protein [uncultured Schumannella sp.]|uniref:hypothetical protein n=1 Tax=uncultured Schumannella sp. TaxID=1195956 RepID=UPI0025D14B34|nr:hypothetical protein [uncultured Schumannella sp.]